LERRDAENSSSVRDPILTDHFWLNPLSQHFSQICVSDLILVNEDGDVVVGDEPINAAAFAIHSESMYPSTAHPFLLPNFTG
jgi:ribulose-5-phosphate 4-epimerase/fuculose-1-phosphate aldolase